MKRLAAVTVWILAGAALTGGVYWAFLNTPESTVGALLLSALLAVIALVLLAITVNGAVAAWSMGPSRESFKTSITGTPTIVPAVAIVGVVWWLTGRVTTWVTAHSGEINAWFIAQFGWDDISALFTGITWVANWIRWVVGPLLSLSLIASLLVGGWQSATRLSWIRRALAPTRLGLATVWFALLVAAPWIYLAPWRPRGLPATSIEIVFMVVKLSVTALLMAVGASVFVREAART